MGLPADVAGLNEAGEQLRRRGRGDTQLDLTRLDPGYWVYFESQADPIDIAADLDHNVRTFERIETGAGAALGRYLDSAEETYRMAVQHFLYTSFASFRPFLDRAVLRRLGRLARLLLQPLDRFAAGYFRDPRLRQILGFPAVFLGSSPGRTPSMYHLMSYLDLADGVLYPQGGFTSVIDSITTLARAEGVRVLTGSRVTAIRAEAGAGRGRAAASAVTGALVATPRLRTRRGAGHARHPGRAPGAAAPHPVLHQGLGGELRPDLREEPERSWVAIRDS